MNTQQARRRVLSSNQHLTPANRKTKKEIERIVKQTSRNFVHNVAANCELLNFEINLSHVAFLVGGRRFNTERSAPLIIRTQPTAHGSTFLLVGRNSVILTGENNTLSLLLLLYRSCAYISRECSIPVYPGNIQQQNIQCTNYMHYNLDMKELHRHLPSAVYHPKNIGCMIYQLATPKCMCLIFSSGSFVITGAKTLADVQQASMQMATLLAEFITVPTSQDKHAPKPSPPPSNPSNPNVVFYTPPPLGGAGVTSESFKHKSAIYEKNPENKEKEGDELRRL